jgi:hypothetical protein
MREDLPARAHFSRTSLIVAALATMTLLGGCFGGGRRYMATVRNSPDCVTSAGINPAKVNACSSRTNRADFNACLASRNVSAERINNLNACIDARQRRGLAGLF